MGIEKIQIQSFLQLAKHYPVMDVRSPAEFSHAHFPGAYNLPLFSDEERKVVGTLYKREGRQQAIKAGLEYFGPKMVEMLETAEKIGAFGHGNSESERSGKKTVIVHCWRGGMRSAGVAWLLDLYGFKVYTLTGGYKSFRRWCRAQFTKTYPFFVIGGYTGSGKTGILKELKSRGMEALDLEELANHRGSVFGHLGRAGQPSQEMFENVLAMELAALKPDESVFLEDESQRIGSLYIPFELFRYIQTRPVFFLEVPFEKRLKHIADSYGKFDKDEIVEAINRIRKRLGGLETLTALEYLQKEDILGCFRILLKYYDKFYVRGLEKKNLRLKSVRKLACENTNVSANASSILQEQDFVMI